MADFNLNLDPRQNLIAAGLNPNDPGSTYIDLAQTIIQNMQRQKEHEQRVAEATERFKQAQLQTKQKQEAAQAGINPEFADYLPKDMALSLVMREWRVKEDDPEIQKLASTWPDMVSRYVVQTIIRKRSMGLGKEIGEPFTAKKDTTYPSTLDGTGTPVELKEGQTYQAYVTEDGVITYLPSGKKFEGTTSVFKPVGITKTGETVSPTREGQLIVKGPSGEARPYRPEIDGELQPFVSPTVASSDLQDIQRLQASIRQLNRIKELFAPGVVGPIQDRLKSLSDITGVDFLQLFTDTSAFDAKNTAFRTALQSAINDYIKAVTGAQMSEAEAVRLQKAIPASGKAQEAFLPALEEAVNIIQMKLDTKLDLMEAAGFRNVGQMRDLINKKPIAAPSIGVEEGVSTLSARKKALLEKIKGL